MNDSAIVGPYRPIPLSPVVVPVPAPTEDQPDTSSRGRTLSLIEEIDARQEDVLAQLDSLNLQIEATIKSWNSDRLRVADADQV